MGRNRLVIGADRDPWERQPGESQKQYARFGFYRDLGRLRTLAQVHRLLVETGDSIKSDTLRQTAYEFRWKDRAEAWDIAQDAAAQEKLIKARLEMVDRHQKIAKGLLAKALEALRIIPVAEMTSADVVRYIKLATDIERIAIGEPQRTISVTGPTGGPVQTEDLTNLTKEERKRRLADIAAELARRIEPVVDDD